MIEPPSKKLVERLTSLNLCRPGDLRRCRSRVRKLARDLPAFDSVWIDALLQNRLVTPFQAKQLNSPHADRLAVGPCVLMDQLGAGPFAKTYLARHKVSGEKCVLKVQHGALNDPPAAEQRLQELISRLEGLDSPFSAGPRSVVFEDGQLVIVSPFVEGTRLTDLLIRRGRFSAAIVREIGRQLIAGLASLESQSIVHGDINLWNVRLTAGGTAVLMDAGITPAVHPEIMIRPDIPPERYDGTAPERITTGFPATVASDMYALGCLLWQLLTGRPPFSTGDPLAKLAQHQTRSIVDVREWAPDTPNEIVAALSQMTAFSPQDRPVSFAELSQQWGPPKKSQSSRLRTFAAGFRKAAPRLRLNRGTGNLLRRMGIALGAGLGLLVAFGVINPEIRALAERIVSPVGESFAALTKAPPGEVHQPVDSQQKSAVPKGPLALPTPNADGVILLETKTYQWANDLQGGRTVTIRGADGATPVVLLGDGARTVTAPTVVLQNLELRANSATRDAAMRIQSRRLVIRDCRFTGNADAKQPIRNAVAWSGPADGAVQWQNVVITGFESVIHCETPPAILQSDNVLQVNGGSFCTMKSPPESGRTMQLILRNVTQRDGTSLMTIAMPVSNRPHGRVVVNARDCVFGLTGERAALFRFLGGFPGQLPSQLVQFSGEGSLIPPGTAIESDGGKPAGSGSEPTAVVIDGGLIAGPFEFAGPPSAKPADSLITKHRAPRRSNQSPGINPATFKP